MHEDDARRERHRCLPFVAVAFADAAAPLSPAAPLPAVASLACSVASRSGVSTSWSTLAMLAASSLTAGLMVSTFSGTSR
jgi:hypothetical protein